MRRVLPLFVLTAVACERPEAPTDLADLAEFFFTEAEADSRLLADGFDNFADVLLDIELSGPRADRMFALPPFAPVVEPVPSDVRWENQVPVGGAGISAFPILDTVATVRLEDQRPVQSRSSVVYDRRFVTDPECFIGRTCETLEVENTITKESPIASLPYELPMTYRWVELEDGRSAYFLRGWMRDRSPGAEDGHWFDQNYHSELWIENPEDNSTTIRWIAVWSSVSIPGVTDEFAAGQVESAIDDAFQRADSWLADP